MISLTKRNVHVPLIRFIGKRSKTNKHVGMFSQAAEAVSSSSAAAATQSSGEAKPLSINATAEFADYPADRWSRLPFTEEEMETINQGTNEVPDWHKIAL